jgi:dihydrodipicolinate synthase/N-acetylneuraminate lyase
VVRRLKRLAGDRLHIAAQITELSAARLGELVRRMQDCGADSLVAATPWLAVTGPRPFVERYFRTALELADRPVGLYLRPVPPALKLEPAMWREYCRHPRVAFIKDSSGSPEWAQVMLEVKRERPELRLLTGNEFDVVGALALGYDGGLLGTGILTGRMIRRLMAAHAAGRADEARALQEQANAFLKELFRPDISGWLGGLKYALVRLGLFDTEFAHLAYEVTPEDRRRIDAALDREQALLRTPACR